MATRGSEWFSKPALECIRWEVICGRIKTLFVQAGGLNNSQDIILHCVRLLLKRKLHDFLRAVSVRLLEMVSLLRLRVNGTKGSHWKNGPENRHDELYTLCWELWCYSWLIKYIQINDVLNLPIWRRGVACLSNLYFSTQGLYTF